MLHTVFFRYKIALAAVRSATVRDDKKNNVTNEIGKRILHGAREFG